MASFTKITALKKIEDKIIEINNQEVIIKQYLSIKEKAELVDYVVQSSFDEKGLLNPLRQKIYTTIGIIRWYTNINLTETMLREIEKTYDLICINHIYENICDNLEEYQVIIDFINCALKETFNHINSFAGQLQYAKTDYQNLNFDMEEMEKTLQDPNQIGFLKEVMEKMG